MEVEYSEGNVIDLIKKLDNDLSNTHDILRLGRIPEPKSGRRYREILFNMFRESGFVIAQVYIDFKSGLRRVFVFTGKAVPTGKGNNFLEKPVYSEGYYVDKKGDEIIKISVYNSYVFQSAKELFKLISKFGDRYRLTDYEVYIDKMVEYINVDDIFSGEVGG